ncbi:hypothetical protein BKA65DRAFT_476218 [Rhexocercosporidium sp. MPI-PUGE-AT-0058]|nr:hypothetical protein BKA65DRAFT_476218 [Rhexocercosporidium sp. MPI-PUGE-AT-0058]
MRSSTICSMVLCSIPALAQTGAKCNIVSSQTVKAGDTLANIAKSANVTLDQYVLPYLEMTSLLENDCLASEFNSSTRKSSTQDSSRQAMLSKTPNTKLRFARRETSPRTNCHMLKWNGQDATVVASDTLIIIAKEKLGIALSALLATYP